MGFLVKYPFFLWCIRLLIFKLHISTLSNGIITGFPLPYACYYLSKHKIILSCNPIDFVIIKTLFVVYFKTLGTEQNIPLAGMSWWHQMETFSALLAICVGNSPVPGEFPTQRPVTGSFDVFFDLCLNKRLSKQSWGWWFEIPLHSLWCHYDDAVLTRKLPPFSTKSLPRSVITNHAFNQMIDVIQMVTKISRNLETEHLIDWGQWPLLLTWFNFNPSMDK